MLVIIGGFVYWFGCSLPFLKNCFPLFSLFVSVYVCVCGWVYVSLCDFVYLGLLLPFVIGFCPFFVSLFVLL